MRLSLIVLPLVFTLLGVIGATAITQSGPPTDAIPGTVGITGVPLGGLEPVAAPATGSR